MIGEGGYGCVYSGNQCEHTAQGVSKVVNRRAGQREIANGNRIRKIDGYERYFVPIDSSCFVHSSTLKQKCRALRRDDVYMVLTMPFIRSLSVTFDRNTFVSFIPHLDKLVKAKMIHFDVKLENMVFTPEPLLIDFGISIDMKIVKKNLPQAFYVYSPDQYEWPIEVHLLCYMMEHPLSPNAVERVCREVYERNPFLENVDECIQHYSFLNTCTREEAIRRLLHGWKTWDLYALTLMLFYREEVPALRPNLHPNPKKRLSLSMSSRLASGSRFAGKPNQGGTVSSDVGFTERFTEHGPLHTLER
jgi:hypothetical protein